MAKKILVADDEPDIVKMLSMRLKAYGYEIIAAFDGLQAVREAYKEKPDLILLDIKMPAGDGYTVFENLKRSVQIRLIPIIFVSALPPREVEEKVAQLGAQGFIAKPFDSKELVAKVKKVLGE